MTLSLPLDTRDSQAPVLGRSPLLLVAAMAAAAVAITFDAWQSIFHMGTVDEELSYVLVAPVVILWLAFVRRHELQHCRIRHLWVGLAMLAAAWLVYWYGYLSDPVLWHAGAVMLAVGALIAPVGSDVLLRFLPALAATVFLVPVSPFGRYRLAWPLQTGTAHATQWVCDLVGIYVDRVGAVLTINGRDVAVEEACNGMRMVLTLFMVCYVVAFTLPMRWWVRLPFLLLTPFIAIAANVTRLVPTIWMFGRFSRDAAELFHTVSGWVMTVVSFLVLMGLFKGMEAMGVPVGRKLPVGQKLPVASCQLPGGELPVVSCQLPEKKKGRVEIVG